MIIWSLECETAIITCFGVSHANFLYGIRYPGKADIGMGRARLLRQLLCLYFSLDIA